MAFTSLAAGTVFSPYVLPCVLSLSLSLSFRGIFFRGLFLKSDNDLSVLEKLQFPAPRGKERFELIRNSLRVLEFCRPNRRDSRD